jgi:DNA-binding HxlR family transcriptional regulator
MGNRPSQQSCDAIGKLLGTITRRWTLHILWILISEGPTRFGALRRKVHGISPRMLTVRLRALESEGLVYRKFKPGSPSEATYGLTVMAAEIGAILEELHHAANRWASEPSIGKQLPNLLMQPTGQKRPAADQRRSASRSV